MLEDAIAFVLFLPAKSALFVLTCRAITTDAFLPSCTRPFRDAYRNVLNALLAPSELAWPFKTLASPRMLGVVLCEVFSRALPRARSPTAIYVSQRIESRYPVASHLILHRVAYPALYVTLLGASSATLCSLDVVHVRLSALSPFTLGIVSAQLSPRKAHARSGGPGGRRGSE